MGAPGLSPAGLDSCLSLPHQGHQVLGKSKSPLIVAQYMRNWLILGCLGLIRTTVMLV